MHNGNSPIILIPFFQIVADALRECRKTFHYQMMAFMSNQANYLAQKPIDDLRQALLKDSGMIISQDFFPVLNGRLWGCYVALAQPADVQKCFLTLCLQMQSMISTGLQAPPELTEPRHPLMLVLLPKSQLKRILFQVKKLKCSIW